MNNNETFFFMLNKYNVLVFGCTQNGKEKKKLNREIRRNDEASKENEAHKSRHKEAKESQYE